MSSAVETSLIIRSKEIARDSSTALRYARNERIEKAFDKAKSLMDNSIVSRHVPSRTHRHGSRAFQFAPTYPCALYSAHNCFPDTVAQHRPIDQAQRNRCRESARTVSGASVQATAAGT